MLIIGAFACIPMLIYDIIVYLAKPDISGIIIGFKENITSVKYFFTPFHFIISEFISEIFNYYIKMIQSGKGNKYDFIYYTINIIIFSVVFFINLVCSLIFNEVIILKFCKLEIYTKKYIHKRARSDANTLFEIDEMTNLERDILSEKEQNNINEE